MTVIVAVKELETGKIWLGGDKYTSLGQSTFRSTQAKVWVSKDSFGNNWVFGVSGAVSVHQVARYQIPLPTEDVSKVEEVAGFIFTKWVTELYRRCKDIGGTVRKDGNSSEAIDGQILIGVSEQICLVAGISASPVERSFHTIGSGYLAAYGALDTIDRHKILLSPTERIESAIAAATSIDPDIGGGIDIVST